MDIKLVIFDLDNTLVITRPAAKKGYKAGIAHIARRFGLETKKDKLYAHWKRMVQKLSQQSDPHKRTFRYSLSQLLDYHKIPETYLTEGIRLYEKELLDNLSLQSGATETLQTLKDSGIKIAVATGSQRSEATKKLKRVDLYRYVDILITSTDVGVMKPHLAYYTLVLDQSGVKPQHTLVVGDDRKEDLDLAQKLGLKTILFPKVKGHLGMVLSQIKK